MDVLLGADPVQGTHTDLPLMKAKLSGKVCLWGGVSAAVTVERGLKQRCARRSGRQWIPLVHKDLSSPLSIT